MKTKTIAAMYRLDPDKFKDFVWKQSEVKVTGFNFDTIADADVQIIVDLYNSYSGNALKLRESEELEQKRKEELMNTCIVCGKTLSYFKTGKIPLSDGALCTSCFSNLGFPAAMGSLYSRVTKDCTFEQVKEFGKK